MARKRVFHEFVTRRTVCKPRGLGTVSSVPGFRDDMLTVDRVAKMDPKPDAAAMGGRLIDLKPSEVRIGP